jgi:hypothetical protein
MLQDWMLEYLSIDIPGPTASAGMQYKRQVLKIHIGYFHRKFNFSSSYSHSYLLMFEKSRTKRMVLSYYFSRFKIYLA